MWKHQSCDVSCNIKIIFWRRLQKLHDSRVMDSVPEPFNSELHRSRQNSRCQLIRNQQSLVNFAESGVELTAADLSVANRLDQRRRRDQRGDMTWRLADQTLLARDRRDPTDSCDLQRCCSRGLVVGSWWSWHDRPFYDSGLKLFPNLPPYNNLCNS